MSHPPRPGDGDGIAPTFIGCAGWALPLAAQHEFPPEGSHLERYSARFNAVEINSSFHRPHRRSTYARWAGSVPDAFAFAVKVPRRITHDLRLVGAADALEAFSGEVSGLGAKLRCLLVQLPPSLVFDSAVASRFLSTFSACLAAPTVIEARHVTWFDDAASAVLERFGIGRVHADPPAVSVPVRPTAPVKYCRMHGSPRIYYSKYEPAALDALAVELAAAAATGIPAWCVFDNTTLGHATSDALALQGIMSSRARREAR